MEWALSVESETAFPQTASSISSGLAACGDGPSQMPCVNLGIQAEAGGYLEADNQSL